MYLLVKLSMLSPGPAIRISETVAVPDFQYAQACLQSLCWCACSAIHGGFVSEALHAHPDPLQSKQMGLLMI